MKGKIIICRCGNSYVAHKWVRLENKTCEFLKIIAELANSKVLTVEISICPDCEKGHC